MSPVHIQGRNRMTIKVMERKGVGSLVSPLAMSRLPRFALLEKKVGQCQTVEATHDVIL